MRGDAAGRTLAPMTATAPSQTRPDTAESFRLYTTTEAAAALGVSKRALQERMAANEVAFVKIGRSTRFSQADLVAFIERNRRKAIGWKGAGRA